MPWAIQGKNIEHCNCNSVCPCLTSGLTRPADNERCTGFLAFDIESGQADGVDLSGRKVVVITDAPQMMPDGGWRIGVIVDDEASDEQVDGLMKAFGGQAGGPMAALAPLIGEVMGVERAPIRFDYGDGTTSVTAGDLVDAEFRDVVQEGASGPLQLVNMTVLPLGPPVNVSPPVRSHIRAFGIEIDNSDRHGTTSGFSWSD
jgi:hypothetical protein